MPSDIQADIAQEHQWPTFAVIMAAKMVLIIRMCGGTRPAAKKYKFSPQCVRKWLQGGTAESAAVLKRIDDAYAVEWERRQVYLRRLQRQNIKMQAKRAVEQMFPRCKTCNKLIPRVDGPTPVPDGAGIDDYCFDTEHAK